MLRKMAALILVALGIADASRAADQHFTDGLSNGRMWDRMPPVARTGYVAGIRDGYLNLLMATCSDAEAADKCRHLKAWISVYLPKSLNVPEMVDAVQRFYTEPENRPITIAEALRIVAKRAAGESEAEISRSIQLLRKSASGN